MTHLQHIMAILKMTGTWLSSFQCIMQSVAVGSCPLVSQRDVYADRVSWITWCVGIE